MSLVKPPVLLLVISLVSNTLLAQCAIVTQPVSQLDCEGSSVRFKVVATGSGLTYNWQRKKPSEVVFTSIPNSENNTTYPAVGEIRVANIGSSQYPDGTQFQVVVSNGTCTEVSNPAILTVNEITDVIGGTNVMQCFGTNYSYTAVTSYPANVVSYRWKKSVASGVWDEISDGGAYSGTNSATLKITGGTPAESAEYRVYISFRSSGADCNVTSTSRTRKITFFSELSAPVATISQPSCFLNTGTITIIPQSSNEEYSFDNGLSFQSANVKSGLAAGFYKVIIKNNAGCLSPTKSCQILSAASIWNGVTWLNGNPDANRSVVFEGDFNSIADIAACSCQVTNGANVVINGAHTLTIANALTVASGSLTSENNASLVQLNEDAINSGNIHYKRYTAAVRRYDYTYWASPVLGQTMYDLSPNTFFDKYYSYNPNLGWQVSYNGMAVMEPGKGYIIRAPQYFDSSVATKDTHPMFVGVPNNGVITLKSLAANKVHLLGNPYPSAIMADAFLDANAGVLEGTLYFWTHNSPPVSFSAATAYNYATNDYAVYNRTGGVGGTIPTGGVPPTGNIAAGQGFFAPVQTTGDVVFNNSMRISGGVSGIDNAQFFRLAGITKTTSIREKNRVWLSLTNTEGAFKQMLIGYITGATNDYDNGFDGVSYDGSQYIDFYSVNNEKNLAIQGRALPFIEKDTVVLGYKSTITGDFQISIDHTDGILNSQAVFLEDKYTQMFHDLKTEPYFFATAKGVFNNRFVLHYVDKNKMDEEMEQEWNEVVVSPAVIVSVEDRKIKINSVVTTIEKVVVYTISGREMFQKNKVNANVFVIPQLISSHQVILVDMLLSNGEKRSRKIVY